MELPLMGDVLFLEPYSVSKGIRCIVVETFSVCIAVDIAFLKIFLPSLIIIETQILERFNCLKTKLYVEGLIL